MLKSITTAHIHLETAFTILDAVLKQGDYGQFEDRAGISRGYLSRLRAGERSVTPRVAESIAKAAPLPPEWKQDLLEQLLAAYEIVISTKQFVEDRDWLQEAATGELLRAHRLAVFSQTPHEAGKYYRALYDLGIVLIKEFSRYFYVLQTAQAHILLHDVLSIYNRPGRALFHAQMARTLLEKGVDEAGRKGGLRYVTFRAEEPWPWAERETERLIPYGDLYINALRSEAVSYNAFHAYARAREVCTALIHHEVVRHNPSFWLPHILRDLLGAMGQEGTFPMSTMESFARWGVSICERNNDEVGLYLIRNQLARGYLKRGYHEQAEAILSDELARVEGSPRMGQLHRALLYANLTDMYADQGNLRGWEESVQMALSIAYRSGMIQIIRRISEEHAGQHSFREIIRHVAPNAMSDE